MSTATINRALAEWAATVVVVDHGPIARSLVQDALLDIVACIVGGSVEPPTRAVVDFARRFGPGAALAMGSTLRLQAPWAALVGGTAAHALDFDDNFAPAVTHATAVLAPALFALAEEEQLSGVDVVDAYIVGLELQARIGRMVNPQHYEKGWHATSTIGTIGAAAGCARLLGLDAERIAATMSIAFSMASGSKKQFGSMMKPIHAGLAAKNAVLAARMAQAGIAGDAEPLDGPWSFAELYGEQYDEQAARASALNNLGTCLAIETDGLLTKRFPCCAAAHRTLDGLMQLRDQHRFRLEAVDRIEVFIPAFARANLRFDHPCNDMEARFSLTYCAARVLQQGSLSLSDMTLGRVRDESVRPWLDRFIIHVKPGSVCDELGANATPAVTRVALKNGQVYEAAIVAPKGSKWAPLTDEEKRAKFHDCCRWADRTENMDCVFELARSMDDLAPFSRFSQSFRRFLDVTTECKAAIAPST